MATNLRITMQLAVVMWFLASWLRAPIQTLFPILAFCTLKQLITEIQRWIKPSPSLMTLPAEVRNIIPEQLLVSTTVVKPWSLTTPLYPSILQVSRQLSMEGRYLIYTKNVFVFDDPRLAIQFFSEKYRDRRSMIREVIFHFDDGIRHIHRRDHPAQSHITLGHQRIYQDLRLLAIVMYQWSVALSSVPAGLRSITIFPYCFFDYCNHVKHGWPLTVTWFCPGCGLQQFFKDNPLEDFVPPSTRRQIHWEQGPQMMIPYQPIWNRNLNRMSLEVRQIHLREVARGKRKLIRNE